MDDTSGGVPFFSLRDDDYEDRLIRWALSYDAYKRLAAGEWEPWGALGMLLTPLMRSYHEEGEVPSWAGVDLLRGWAFLLVRRNRHEDGYLLDEHPEMYAIARAITSHPAARESDMPPVPEVPLDWM